MKNLNEITNGRSWKELVNTKLTDDEMKVLKERSEYLESQDFDGYEDEYAEMMKLRTILSYV